MIVGRDSAGTDPTARGESSALVGLGDHQSGPPRRVAGRPARTELAASFPSALLILAPALLVDLRHLDAVCGGPSPAKTAPPDKLRAELNRLAGRLPRGLPPLPAGPAADPKGDDKGKRAFARAEKKAVAARAVAQPQ